MTLPCWTPASLEGEEWDLVFPERKGSVRQGVAGPVSETESVPGPVAQRVSPAVVLGAIRLTSAEAP